MKKTIMLAIVVALMLSLIGSGFAANAESLPSSKAAAIVSETTLIDWSADEGWKTILDQSIKTPNQKDLFIDVSLETGLYTRTLVRSKANNTDDVDDDWDVSNARAEIQVQVVIDEGPNQRIASPGPVVFDMRNQTLSAKFMGIFTGECFSVDDDGNVTIIYECLEPEELELILETMAASSFNFVIDQLSPGVHTVSVKARIATNGSADAGEYEAKALVGKGSVVIEVVRMIQGAEWLID